MNRHSVATITAASHGRASHHEGRNSSSKHAAENSQKSAGVDIDSRRSGTVHGASAMESIATGGADSTTYAAAPSVSRQAAQPDGTRRPSRHSNAASNRKSATAPP